MMNTTINNATVKELRTLAKTAGIKGYSRMKKDELVQALVCKSELNVEVAEVQTTAPVVPPVGVGYTINPLDDPEVMALDVSDEALLQPVVSERLMKAIAREIMFQTIPSKDGKLVIKKDKDGKLILQTYALFFRPTKSDCKGYMVVGKRLWGVISMVVGSIEGEDKKTSNRINEVLEQMEALDMITRVASERTYATLNPTDMSQDEKDQLNDLWRTRDIKTEKVKDGCIKTTALTDKGKKVLNELYPCWVYKATAAQLNKVYLEMLGKLNK